MDFSISEFRSTISTVAEMYKKGMNQEAEGKLLELREEYLRLREENLDLRTQVHELEEANLIKSQMVFEEPFYFLVKGEDKDGPFCQRCFDVNELTVRLKKIASSVGSHRCAECGTAYGEGIKRRPVTRSRGGSSWMER